MSRNEFLKEYIKVSDRIIKFYEKYPEGSIQTNILTIDDDKVVIKAYAYRNSSDTFPATGHAEEIRNSNYINKTNAVENCETSAVGRALANLGFEIKHSVASREEMEQALNKREFIENNNISLEELKKQVFSNATSKGISNDDLKKISHDVTNKNSSKYWTSEDINNINKYINSINNH